MRRLRKANLVSTAAVTLLTGAAWAAVPPACTPPPDFKDTPHPAIAPIDQLVSHTEEVVVNRPLDVVLAESERTSLNQAVRKSDSLPGVSGTYALTSGDFGKPGSRRLVCLTDGSTTEEEVLEKSRDKNSAQFRYVVWNYTTEKARPILYGVGHFVWTDPGGTVSSALEPCRSVSRSVSWSPGVTFWYQSQLQSTDPSFPGIG